MIRLLCPQRFELGAGLALLRVALVGWLGGGDERDRMEDLRFRVRRLARDQIGHRPLVLGDARSLVDVLEIAIEAADGGDVAALTLARAIGEPRRVLGEPPPLGELRRSTIPRRHRIAPASEGSPPLGHRTGRVGGEHLAEGARRCSELERVQQRYGAIHSRRDGRRARRLEMHGAELLGRGRVVMVLCGSLCGRERSQRDCAKGCADA
jgi:hypothetical protein